ncbi:MAG TPA: DUF736 domain-containing protein [Rhizomicrobium sp.]
MATIGTFKATKAGGWEGRIRTLTINLRAKFVPNDDRAVDMAPAFLIFCGTSQIGAAWRRRTGGSSPRDYLSAKFEDPMLVAPVSAALFEDGDGHNATLVWNFRNGD